MAGNYFRRGLLVAAITACTLSFATAATIDSGFDNRTRASTDYPTVVTGNFVVVSFQLDFDLARDAVLVADHVNAVTKRGYHAFKPMAVKERVASAAILATRQAGWRSGRLRKLSAG